MDNSTFLRLVNGIEMPTSDSSRDVKGFTLPNGLKAVVISDPTTETSACSVEVSVGSFSDPDNLPGLAHFLEHMLFMGTAKYPDENSFSAFLNEHGGYSNAYTAAENTNYHFEVQSDTLRETLDRFSGFFTCPLLTASGAARELDAVDSENSKNLLSDAWRGHQLDKFTSDPSHPYHKFGTGNKDTLGDGPAKAGVDVRAALLEFHRVHYSAGRSTLCLVGAEGVDVLEAWVVEMFSAYGNNGSAASVFPPLPVSSLRLWRVPIKDSRTLTLSWTLPSMQGHWRSKPLSYLSHLIGHEGPGSVLSALMARGWATGLYSGESEDTSCFAKFETQVTLSPEGLAHGDEVLGVLFAYLGMLEAHGPQKWVWEEDAGVKGSKFKFESKPQPISAATSTTEALAVLPFRHVFSGDKLMWDWDPATLTSVLAAMTPGAAKITLVSKDPLVTDLAKSVEKWYGTQYHAAPIPPALVATLEAAKEEYKKVTLARLAKLPAAAAAAAGGSPHPSTACVCGGVEALGLGVVVAGEGSGVGEFPPLTLPHPNPFIASDFTLCHPHTQARRVAEGSGGSVAVPPTPPAFSKVLGGGAVKVRREPVPTLLQSSPGRTLWWHCDDFFAQPKMQCYACISMPTGASTPRGCAMLDMYQVLVTESLRELGYAAQLAGLSYGVNLTAFCELTVYVSGFNQRAPVLLSKVAAALASPVFTEEEFAMHKEAKCRAYANTAMDQPINQAARYVAQCLVRPTWNRLSELLPEATTLTSAEVRAAIPTFLSAMSATLMVCGNAGMESALACGEALWGPLTAAGARPPPPSLSTAARVTALPPPLIISTQGALTTLCFDLVRVQKALNPADPNGAVELLVQFGPPAGPKRAAIIQLISHVVRESFFDDLRTKQTLGYIVQSSIRLDAGITSLCFRVQSTKVTCQELLAKVETFLAGFAGVLASMPPDKFKANCVAVAVDCSIADKNMGEEAGRLWGEISEPGKLVFDRASQEAAALLELSQSEVVAFFKECVAPGGRNRRTFASMVERGTVKGEGEGEEGKGKGMEEDDEEDDDEEEEEEEEEMASEGKVAGGKKEESMELISAPLVGELIGMTPPIDKVASALAALSGACAGMMGGVAYPFEQVVEAFEWAGLKEVVECLTAANPPGKGAAAIMGPGESVFRLKVDVGSGREAVGLCLPVFPEMAAVRKV